MKVLLLNGSPHEHGCTAAALDEIAKALHEDGVETGRFWIGTEALHGCTACGACRKLGKCVFDDRVNEFLKIADEYDGLIVGSPVHYASACGAVTSFLDRAFYAGGKRFAHKPAAAIVSARRAGTTAALDQLNKYFLISEMPIVSSQYWNMVHGHTPEQVQQDLEGLQIMRTLGHNMAWMLRCIAAGKESGVITPQREPFTPTNFIR